MNEPEHCSWPAGVGTADTGSISGSPEITIHRHTTLGVRTDVYEFVQSSSKSLLNF